MKKNRRIRLEYVTEKSVTLQYKLTCSCCVQEYEYGHLPQTGAYDQEDGND